MARREITTPLDLKNLNNHNGNYEELYGLIDETDRRLSENMWEEIKGANTMKMLEPVQTAAELPATAEDKSLITVIDEQKVYAYVHDEWQPFSEIDLDPFEPFKTELSEIVAAYESQIQNITQEVQTTKDSAIESIQSTQTQSESNINQTEQSAISSINQTQAEAESNINQTEQSAVNSINKTQAEAESQISTIRDEMTTQASDLTALFNDHMAQLTSKQDTALAEVESAKQAAITALEDFNNTDTSNWQKYKLTQDDGGAKNLSGVDWADTAQLDALEAGIYYATSTVNPPIGTSSYNAFITVTERNDGIVKHIEYRPYNSNQVFIKRFYETWSDWEPAQGTNVELFSGSLTEMNKNISLKDDPRNYSFLIIELSQIGGDDTAFVRFRRDYAVIRTHNLGNSGNGSTLIETTMKLDSADPTKIYADNSIRVETETATGKEYVPEILKIVGVK
ncbi:hypothetical protein PYH58_10520 [Mammaliicoccus sciuri]|uniref:hypothetical protein n=1 Tax=Mammaliicoccus sciuri TaxID=1296 RepID=UPI003364B9C8